MEEFELKIDLNTPYIKTIHFLGAALFGFFVGVIFFNLKYEGDIDWINSATGIMCSLLFAFFPGAAKKQSLTINETGIYLQNYTFHWGQKKEVTWEKVREIRVHKNAIEIKNSIGSTEKINLPLHTKSQLEDLRTYLKQVAKIKELEFIK
ncbi:MAG TPA: hypothetical protein VFM80_05610 [Gracilimonas sp.]|uniref:hypothetical protein n=1 Tax=Gracilimonas sp. TaxID=1974203 RepID=UPI002D9FBA50|nr:hypothetical protein [Gracilimonas sp.]